MPAPPAPPARPGSGHTVAAFIRFYPVLDAQLAPADPHPKSSRCLEPFCSWILGWRCFRDSGSPSCRRGDSPGDVAGEGTGSWLRVGIRAQPETGETLGLVPWAGRAANLLQPFLCCLELRAGDLSPVKAPGQSLSAVLVLSSIQDPCTAGQSRRGGSAAATSRCHPCIPASSRSCSHVLLSL